MGEQCWGLGESGVGGRGGGGGGRGGGVIVQSWALWAVSRGGLMIWCEGSRLVSIVVFKPKRRVVGGGGKRVAECAQCQGKEGVRGKDQAE